MYRTNYLRKSHLFHLPKQEMGLFVKTSVTKSKHCSLTACIQTYCGRVGVKNKSLPLEMHIYGKVDRLTSEKPTHEAAKDAGKRVYATHKSNERKSHLWPVCAEWSLQHAAQLVTQRLCPTSPSPSPTTTQRNGRACLDCSFQLTFICLSTHCQRISPTCPQGSRSK